GGGAHRPPGASGGKRRLNVGDERAATDTRLQARGCVTPRRQRREWRFERRRSARRRSRKRRLSREPVVGQLRLQGQGEARERAPEGRARREEGRHRRRRWNAH
ncbi:unnamed protein product, partial [Ectocarpus sp. 13 AM-2016]